MKDIIEETIRLIELARKGKDIARDIDAQRKNIINHLLKCLLYPTHKSYNHWKQEIYNFLNDVDLVKGKNIFPTYKQLYSWTIDNFSDVLPSRIDRYVLDISSNYSKVDKYNSENLYSSIYKYYDWLIKNLSKTGEVTSSEVSNEIDEIVSEYNNSLK